MNLSARVLTEHPRCGQTPEKIFTLSPFLTTHTERCVWNLPQPASCETITFFLTNLSSANSLSEPRSVQSCSFEVENAGEIEYRPIVKPSTVETPATISPLI